jgi:hypothetical protein
MLKASTGSSVLPQAFDAGKAAAAEIKSELKAIKAAFVYASCAYDLDEMVKGIRSELPGVPFVGNHILHRRDHTERFCHGR